MKKAVAQVPFNELFDRPVFNEEDYRAKGKVYFGQLTEDEAEAIKLYTNSAYHEINLSLYSGQKRNAEVKEWVTSLDAALAKAPEAPKALWRCLSGFELPKEFLTKNHKIGDTLKFKGYTSTSETPDALMHIPSDVSFYMRDTPYEEQELEPGSSYSVRPTAAYTEGPAKNVLFKISTKQAAPASMTRATVNEQEWLIPRGKAFRVVAIQRNVEISKLEHIRNPGTRTQVFELEEI